MELLNTYLNLECGFECCLPISLSRGILDKTDIWIPLLLIHLGKGLGIWILNISKDDSNMKRYFKSSDSE